jgi:hypothetical protein
LFSELGVGQRVDEWTMRMRGWMERVVMKGVGRELDGVRNEMKGLIVQAMGSSGLREDEKAVLRGVDRGQLVAACDLLSDRLPNRPECTRYRQMSKFIKLKAGHADYTWQRLIELSGDSGLDGYRWNGGGKEWREGQPMDSTLVCHCWWVWVADFYPLYQQMAHEEGGERKGRGKVVMVQWRVGAPYYCLMVEEGKGEEREWRCEPGRSNLWQCLTLLIWWIKHRGDGRRLKDRALEGLDEVVD